MSKHKLDPECLCHECDIKRAKLFEKAQKKGHSRACSCKACVPFKPIAVEKLFDAFFQKKTDTINHPDHYTKHPSGVECIEITEHMSYTLGNVIKYVWRADLKNGVEDLQKAIWYLQREIKRRSVPSDK